MNAIPDSFIVYVSLGLSAVEFQPQIDQWVARHRQLDWGYADDRVCVTNDANLLRGSGLVISVFHTLRGHRVVVSSDLDRKNTLIRLADEL